MDDQTLYDYWMVIYRRKRAILLLIASAGLSAIFSPSPVYYVLDNSVRLASVVENSLL